jgi:outer membrane protein
MLTAIPGIADAQGSGVRFGFVDVARVMNSSAANKKALTIFKKKLAAKQREIDNLEGQIKRQKEQLDSRSAAISDAKRQEIKDDIRDKLREYRRLGEDHQAELDRENRVWTKKITKTLRSVVEEVGRDGQFAVIYAKAPVFLFLDDRIDVSEEVLRRLDARTAKWFQ